MGQDDIAYDAVKDGVGTSVAVSIFADRVHLRDEISDDVRAAGLTVRDCGPVAALLEDEVRPLGLVVLLDCATGSGTELAALSRLDARAARANIHLIVSTTVAALEDVFACCDQSAAQILVEPSRVERLVALGRALASASKPRVRELSEGDRLTLLRLIEQVSEIAERVGVKGAAGTGAFRFESPAAHSWGAAAENGDARLSRATRPPLPDPALVRRIIRQRQLRARYFDGELFADPAWDILLDLTAASAEHKRVSVTSLCIASGVPPTTALRWISQMVEIGLLVRIQDEADRRRVFIALSDSAASAMARYFAELGSPVAQLV
ncbi:winged helix DNA-binding protein [Altererythrobacter soli]|uniref:Winged helix DNA-binding protein n=1 Tax=Croceibacterium soli TaxID=1739690 RepID=A0A6I4UVB4_9SPHN|nr:winged helix DNA-binding protein [Croceibacterium soli]MXP41443.1 winged helix DNA-binding protein [Croceibacterium soli]